MHFNPARLLRYTGLPEDTGVLVLADRLSPCGFAHCGKNLHSLLRVE